MTTKKVFSTKLNIADELKLVDLCKAEGLTTYSMIKKLIRDAHERMDNSEFGNAGDPRQSKIEVLMGQINGKLDALLGGALSKPDKKRLFKYVDDISMETIQGYLLLLYSISSPQEIAKLNLKNLDKVIKEGALEIFEDRRDKIKRECEE